MTTMIWNQECLSLGLWVMPLGCHPKEKQLIEPMSIRSDKNHICSKSKRCRLDQLDSPRARSRRAPRRCGAACAPSSPPAVPRRGPRGRRRRPTRRRTAAARSCPAGRRPRAPGSPRRRASPAPGPPCARPCPASASASASALVWSASPSPRLGHASSTRGTHIRGVLTPNGFFGLS